MPISSACSIDRVTRVLASLPLPDVEAGVSAIRARFDALLAAGHRVALVDALTDRHVGAIAEACSDLRLVTGGAALGGALGARGVVAAVTDEIPITSPVVILSGSCSAATRQQIDRLGGACQCAVDRSRPARCRRRRTRQVV